MDEKAVNNTVEQRENSIRQGLVSDAELKADGLAVKYFGKDYVTLGLEEILKIEENVFKDTELECDRDQYDLSTEELRLRINRLKATGVDENF